MSQGHLNILTSWYIDPTFAKTQFNLPLQGPATTRLKFPCGITNIHWFKHTKMFESSKLAFAPVTFHKEIKIMGMLFYALTATRIKNILFIFMFQSTFQTVQWQQLQRIACNPLRCGQVRKHSRWVLISPPCGLWESQAFILTVYQNSHSSHLHCIYNYLSETLKSNVYHVRSFSRARIYWGPCFSRWGARAGLTDSPVTKPTGRGCFSYGGEGEGYPGVGLEGVAQMVCHPSASGVCRACWRKLVVFATQKAQLCVALPHIPLAELDQTSLVWRQDARVPSGCGPLLLLQPLNQHLGSSLLYAALSNLILGHEV